MSRSDSATIAALSRWMKEDPAANAARGQAGLVAKLAREVDELAAARGEVLSEAERARRTAVARRLHMTRVRLARSRRSPSPGGEAA